MLLATLVLFTQLCGPQPPSIPEPRPGCTPVQACVCDSNGCRWVWACQ